MLGSGEPIGFYGLGNGGRSNGAGMNMSGVVYRFDKLEQERPYYVEMEAAKKYKAVSALLLVSASLTESKRFAEYWDQLEKSPGAFDIVGGNCSTHASAGFVYCGLLKNGIPGLDTPDNLFRQLSAQKTCQARYGYIGFVRVGSVFEVSVEAATAAEAIKSGSSAPARSSQSQSFGLPSTLNASKNSSRATTHPSTSRP